ncbi:hypothetical protein CF319_g8687 [Tilletia indica]|nr:hypothetical protein CF319_g8687 [Tilletia indica]
MSTALRFFTLSPVDSPLPPQTVVFSLSDQVQLLLGGIRFDYHRQQRPPHHTADFIFDEQVLIPNHGQITHINHATGLTNCSDSGKTRVNGIPLAQDERVILRDGDQVELGHLDEYSGNFRNTLTLAVHLSNSPPTAHRQPLPAHSLLASTIGAFHGLRALQDSEKQLRGELQLARQQLREALDTAAAHICAPAPPPRPYGTLLADLRSTSEVKHLSRSVSPIPSLASSASDSSSLSRPSPSLLEYESSPSSSDRRSAVAASSMVASASASSSPSASPSTKSSTSVLTSVLRSGSSTPRSLNFDAPPSLSCSFLADDTLTAPSVASSPALMASVFSSVLRAAPTSSSHPSPNVSSPSDVSSSTSSPAATSMTAQPHLPPPLRAPSHTSSLVSGEGQSAPQNEATTACIQQCPFALDTSTVRPPVQHRQSYGCGS